MGKQFKRNWEVGINWRFQSGLPFTPFSDASALAINWDVNYRGVLDYNQLNTERRDAASTIDLRVDFLRQGIGKHFIATAEVIRLGGRVGSTQMKLVNQDGTLIATGNGAYMVS